MAGLSLEELSNKMNNTITRQALNKYEQGKMMHNGEVLMLLAKALEIKPEYFFRPARISVELSQAAYRKNSRLGKKKQASIQEKVREYVERFLDAESLFPPERFPDYPLKPLVAQIKSLHQVEELAERLRDEWELGTDPIDNLVQLLEDRNIIVVQVAHEDHFDGLSCWANQSKPVAVIKDGVPGDRQRSSLAHELGHLLIHSTQIDEEKAAFRFAAAFLVPRKTAFYELGQRRQNLSLNELHQLKMKFGGIAYFRESCCRTFKHDNQ
jgi:Zn-dependent peptidase ImmA (M78 family)